MDVVSGTASVVAIVGVALKSIKIICETISRVKDGPSIILQTASALESLQEILEWVQVKNITLPSSNTDLPGLAQRCAAILKAFEKKIECVRILPTDNRSGKAWKRVKTVLKQDDFQQMWETINQQIKALSLGLQLTGLDAGLAFKESLHQLNEQNTVVRTTSAESMENVQKQLGKIMTSTFQQALNASTTTGIVSRSESSLGRLEEGVEGLCRESVSFHTSTCQDIEGLSARMEKLSYLSEDQSGKLASVLEQLQYLTNAEAKKKSQDSEAHGMPTTSADDKKSRASDENQMQEHDEELKSSLERLCRHAGAKEKTIFSEEAQHIIEDIELLLNAVSSTMETCSYESRGEKRRWCRDYDSDSDAPNDKAPQYKRGIKRIKGVLATSQCILVNPKATPRPLRVLGRKYKTRFLHHQRHTNNGTISVRASSKLLKEVVDDTNAQDDRDPEGTIEVFESVLMFLPNTVPNSSFSISFLQRSTSEGSLLGKPIISFSATLPNNSKVFERIKDGDMKGLLKMFEEGTAALTDRDAKGRSLLNYALDSLKPSICKFLVEHGADVDAIEEDRKGVQHPMLKMWGLSDFSHLLEFDFDIIATRRRVLSKELGFDNIIACRRVLLEVGADPTVESYSGGSLLSSVLLDSSEELLRQVLDLSREFIDLEERDQDGSTALLTILRWSGYHNIEVSGMVGVLLARGANPRSTLKNSLSCLHTCIQETRETECLKTLVLLMKAGADPWVVTSSGESITQSAYTMPIEGQYDLPRRLCRGNRGMIWEQALTACGYNAADFRQSFLDVAGRLDFFRGDLAVDRDQYCCIGLEAYLVASSSLENEQRRSEGQNLSSTSVTESNHIFLPPLRGFTQPPAAEMTDLRLPYFAQVLAETRYSRDTTQEGLPMAESSYSQFRNPFNTVSTQHNNESTDANTWTPPNYQVPRSQNDHVQQDHTFVSYQNETSQPNVWPRIQELDLLEGDAEVWRS